ncbi:odorant receptor 131-2-like [Misgurnus anguillicaudatus]|uniref:odorant receptor 131-2-like n=1 Tax=Misgurnus anguillicaudatus TaxID=75329 RepID=UPI003CCF5C39
MNSTIPRDPFNEAFMKNFISVALGLIINYINGTFVLVFLKNDVFHRDPRYILYIHLVINDMIMLSVAVGLQVATYIVRFFNVSVCCLVLLLANTVGKNTLLNLACMSIERYIAICKPLHHSQVCTVRRTYILICFIWTMSITPSLSDILIMAPVRPVSFFSTTIYCVKLYIYNTWQHDVKDIVVNVVYLSFVWITLIVTYIKVLLAANAAVSDQTSAKKSRNTILLHGFQLLLCMLSYVMPLLLTKLVELYPQSQSTILYIQFLLANILPRLLIPLIYGVRDKQFAQRIRLYFCCK